MKLKEKINRDFLEAYKNKEMNKKTFLGVLKGAIQTQEGKMVESTDENVLKVVKSFEKGIKETIEVKRKMGENVDEQIAELSYLESYLPELMSEDEIRSIVSEMVNREGINKNEGFLMGLFNKEQNGKGFDNKTLFRIIKENLS